MPPPIEVIARNDSGQTILMAIEWKSIEVDAKTFDENQRKMSPTKVEKIESRTLFTIGQGYEGTPAKTLQCSICGGVEFYVGQGDYFTAIMCVKCRWEGCIHDG